MTDHAHLMGLLPLALDPTTAIAKSEVGKLIATGDPKDSDKAFGIMMKSVQAGQTPKGFDDMKVQLAAWEKQREIANVTIQGYFANAPDRTKP